MRRQPSLAILLCVTLSLPLIGCPIAGSMVAGPWQVNLDDMCDESVELRLGMLLESDGSAQFYAGSTYMGTWELEEAIVTITFFGPSPLTLAGTLSMDGTSMTNGTATGALSGCWTADRIEY